MRRIKHVCLVAISSYILFISVFVYCKGFAEEEGIEQRVQNILLRGVSISDKEDYKFVMLKELGPEALDVMVEIAEKNYKAQIRTVEHVLADSAIFYLGEFRYKKSLPFLRKIGEEYKPEDWRDNHIRKTAIQSIMKIDFEGNKDIYEKALDPEETEDELLRYDVAEWLEKHPSDISIDLLRKALGREEKDGVLLRIDETLSKIDAKYKDSNERKVFLRSRVLKTSHDNYKKEYQKRLKDKF